MGSRTRLEDVREAEDSVIPRPNNPAPIVAVLLSLGPILWAKHLPCSLSQLTPQHHALPASSSSSCSLFTPLCLYPPLARGLEAHPPPWTHCFWLFPWLQPKEAPSSLLRLTIAETSGGGGQRDLPLALGGLPTIEVTVVAWAAQDLYRFPQHPPPSFPAKGNDSSGTESSSHFRSLHSSSPGQN